MNIDILTLGSYQTNCYLVWAEGSDRCAVIDPGFQPETILDRLAQLQLGIDAILLTHGHFDHVGAVETLAKAAGCPVWIHQGDYTQKRNPINNYLYPIHDGDFCVFSFCEEGENISAGGLAFRCMETPGHTRGSVCYLCEDALFTGDTLFAGSCGRTDLPGGSRATLTESLERLRVLDGDFRVFPGHGGSSTLPREKQTNPYLGGWL